MAHIVINRSVGTSNSPGHRYREHMTPDASFSTSEHEGQGHATLKTYSFIDYILVAIIILIYYNLKGYCRTYLASRLQKYRLLP